MGRGDCGGYAPSHISVRADLHTRPCIGGQRAYEMENDVQ